MDAQWLKGSIQVSGDMPTLPLLRPKVWVGSGLGLKLGVMEGKVGMSPETWIDPIKQRNSNTLSIPILPLYNLLKLFL